MLLLEVETLELNKIVIPKMKTRWKELAYAMNTTSEKLKYLIKKVGISMNAVKSFLETGLRLVMVLHPKLI